MFHLFYEIFTERYDINRVWCPTGESIIIKAFLLNMLGHYMDYWEELEKQIRERGVRVEQRIELLNLLKSGEEGERSISDKKDNLLERIRLSGAELRRSIG